MLNRKIRLMLQQATGLDLAKARVADAVMQRMKQCGVEDHDAYTAGVLSGSEELEALIELVVVPETWFFRDAEAFSAACGFSQDRLARNRRPVRVLSIPCASGEEPYSLAMTLLDGGLAPADFIIEGIDISRHAMERAQRGIYHRNAFRTRDLAFRDRYFIACANGYELRKEVRDLVRFRHGNLLALDDACGMQAFDIVFCRNLLIYFNESTQRAAIGKLHALLAEDGLLFAGYAETAAFCRHDFVAAPFSKAFSLRKKGVSDVAEKPLKQPRAGIIKDRQPRVQKSRDVSPQQPAIAAPVRRQQQQVQQAAEQPSALLLNARDLADRGRIDDARMKYRAYLQIVPDSDEAYFMLGLLSEQKHEAEAAEAYLRRAVYLNPDHYEALCHLALLVDRHGDAGGAASLKQRAARVFRRQSGGRTDK